MSDNEKTETETYTPPAVSWLLPVFMDAPIEEIKKKIVDCATCPVFLLCEAGQGGTGWTCMKCNATGVYVDMPVDNKMPNDVLALDCGKHKFERRKEAEQVTMCALCSGGLMELEVLAKGTKNHLIVTAHSKVPVEERQKVLKESYEKWKKHYAEKAAKKK